jgi:glycosyltransferase involved in cell wall biosynthesis
MQFINSDLTLQDLPAPPPGKIGWPWTEQSQTVPHRLPDGSEWPRISIVTPSYNQGQFLEETIRSVLLQGYSNLEYIIIDGGSTDNSVEIIRKYEPWLTYWVSEPDKGQTDAIQKGFNRVTGVLWNWINSDDFLEPNALHVIADVYHTIPSATIYSGKLKIFGCDESYLHLKRFQNLSELICVWEEWPDPQPAIFMSSKAYRNVQGLNTSLHYAMDYDLYLRLAQLPSFKAQLIDYLIAHARRHSTSKTVNQWNVFRKEILQVFDDFARQHPSLLPHRWYKSRIRCQYHSDLDSSREVNNGNLSLFAFLKISQKFLLYIWDYHFFWASLFSFIKAYFNTFKNIQLT